jgi:hypothetical protein
LSLFFSYDSYCLFFLFFFHRSPRSFFEVNLDELRAAAQLPEPSPPFPVPDEAVDFNQLDDAIIDDVTRGAVLEAEAAAAVCSIPLLGQSGCPASFLELASQCLDPEPSSRPTAEEAEGWLEALAKDLRSCPDMRHGEPPRLLAAAAATATCASAGKSGSLDPAAGGEEVARSATSLMDHLFGDEEGGGEEDGGEKGQRGGGGRYGSSSTVATTTTNSSRSSSKLTATMHTVHSSSRMAPARAFFLVRCFTRRWVARHRSSATIGNNKDSNTTTGSSSSNYKSANNRGTSSSHIITATASANSRAAFLIAAPTAVPSSITRASSAPAAVQPLPDSPRDSLLASESSEVFVNHPAYLEVWLWVLASALLFTLVGF